MKYILMFIITFLLAGCSDSNDNGEVVVVGNDSQSASVQHETEDDGAEEDIFTVTEGTEEEETSEPENNAEIEVGSDDFSINNIEPNAVAQMVNEGDFEVVSESDKEFYEKITDIDDDGTDETVQILKNTDINEDSVQPGHYILAIFDESGEARYAEYTYDFYPDTAPRILDIADLDDDGISEIILKNLTASNATAAAGLQSPSRFIYKYDDSIGQFTNVSSLGRFFKNEAVADYDVYINDFITDLDYTFSYEEAVENPESEGHLRDLIDFGVIDENEEGLADDFVENTHGNQRYQHASAVENIEGGITGILYEDPVYPMRWLTLNATSLYEYNPEYDWLEIVGMDGELDTSVPVGKTRDVFSIGDFNDRFETDGVSADDYYGEWTRVIDGRLQEVNILTLSIDESEIEEANTENAGIMGHNSSIELDTVELDENTNQLKVTGEVIENDALDVNNEYDNTFTILYIEGTKHMIDKYGDFYLQL